MGERGLIQPQDDERTTIKLLENFKDVSVYGFLLNPDPNHPLEQVIRERWMEMHYLTGEKIMIVATGAPVEYSENLKNYWKEKLGADFEKTWQVWQRKPDAGVAYQYLERFNLKESQLPCLVLYTDPGEKQAVVRSLPPWDVKSLYRLLKNLLEATRQCTAQVDEEERLMCLADSLTSPSVVILDNLDYVKDKALGYIKEHPAEILKTTASFALALVSGNVIALGPSAVAILEKIKELSESSAA